MYRVAIIEHKTFDRCPNLVNDINKIRLVFLTAYLGERSYGPPGAKDIYNVKLNIVSHLKK